MDSTTERDQRGRRAVLFGLGGIAVLGVSGCTGVGQSQLNPLNWFGRSRVEEAPSLAPSGGFDEERDTRPTVAEVASMKVDRVPGGAIVTATGLPPTQGFWSAELVPVAVGVSGRPVPEGTTLTFEFRILPPEQSTRQGPAQSRELSASAFLTEQDLDGVRTITVRGQNNQRSARR